MTNLRSSIVPALSVHTPLLTNHALTVGEEQDAEDTLTANNDSTASLRRVADSLPLSVWIIAIIELCERFAFFGIIGPMQNYLQNSSDDELRPGGIGLGQSYTTAVNQTFVLWCFMTPIFGAIAADQYFGRLRTIIFGAVLYMMGLVVLVLSSLPVSQESSLSFPGILTAMLLIGMGTGGLKSNVSSLVAEQYKPPADPVRVQSNGERVILDTDMTIQRIFINFSIFINVGSLAAIATTTIEMKYGFTAAFSVPTIVFFIGFAAILLGKRYLVHHPPTHSILFHGSKALWIAAKHGFNLSAAKKSFQSELEHPEILHWDDIFVDELSTAFRACRLFLFYPFYWVAYNQFLTNFISQAATMETHSIPNDILINIEPISVLIFLLLLDRVIYPLLQRAKIPFKSITRIATGFLLVSAAMAYAAFVQNTIYTSPPCFQYPRAEDCRSGKVPNRVHVALQTPAYILIAMSETLASVSGAEYAYTNAPASMKSIVMALYLSTSSVGAGFAILLTPLTVDPLLTWMYSALSVEAFVSGVALWLVFSWL